MNIRVMAAMCTIKLCYLAYSAGWAVLFHLVFFAICMHVVIIILSVFHTVNCFIMNFFIEERGIHSRYNSLPAVGIKLRTMNREDS